LQAIRRGQDSYLEEANQLLQRLRDDYPNDPLLFRALLEQGDIFRRLNQFSVAERIYELADNTYPNHPERIVAQLSLADTLRAQASSDPLKFEAAISRLEKLTDLPSAPADLRAEAGFKLGFSWQTQGRNERAAQVYWQVYTRLFSDAAVAESLGAKGRFWVGKCLLELGQLEELAGRNDEARRWYEAVIENELPGEKVARGRLGRQPRRSQLRRSLPFG
jgi:tetratricopeptide (TPR) repeat protein